MISATISVLLSEKSEMFTFFYLFLPVASNRILILSKQLFTVSI